MVAHLYLENEGYMIFDNGQRILKFIVPKKLNTINLIKTCDDGYLVLDTNYGEEYIDLKAIANEINLNINFNGINLVLGRS